MAVRFEQLLKTVVERGGSELYVMPHTPPQIRIDGLLVPLDMPSLTDAEVRMMLTGYLREEQWAELQNGDPVMHGVLVKGLAQFRLTAYSTDRGLAASAKVIPYEIYGFLELGLPEILRIMEPGLTLIGGPRDSGRSSTLAALIDKINRETHAHITIFGPASGMLHHQHKSSLVDQVVFTETPVGARRAAEIALWGNADVVAFDEVYGIEAIRTMIQLAQTGCRVAATVPGSKTARDVVEAILSLVPPFARPTLQTELAYVLRRVAAQMLLPKGNGKGRVLALEIVEVNDTVRAAIERGQLSVLERATAEGMSLNESLGKLQAKNLIAPTTALEATADPKGLEKAVQDAKRTGNRQRAPRPR